MIDDEMQFLLKFFTERIQYIIRIMARCQQEGITESKTLFSPSRFSSLFSGQLDKIPKYRQLHDQMSAFVRNPSTEHLIVARRLKEHIDRILGLATIPAANDTSTVASSSTTGGTRLMTNGIFEQCQRTIIDYLGKDPMLKYNIAKRFLEPLSEVLNGVPHKYVKRYYLLFDYAR
jgi:hypothetical protein